MSKYFNHLTMAILAIGLCVAGSAFATNGYFTHGTGTKNKAMAGSGIALPEDAIDTVNNPALAPFVGDQFIIGAALFSPQRKYRTTESELNGQFGSITIGPNNIDSDSNLFVIPHLAKSWQLKNDAAWAIAFYGRGGMNTDWKGGTATFDPDGPGPAGPMAFPGTYGAGVFGGNGNAGVNLSQAFLDFTWAKKTRENFSLGISAVLVAQMFEAKGVMSFAPLTRTFAASGGTKLPENLSNNGTDWSYGGGLRFGLYWSPSETVSIGASYQTKILMTEFDEYADLFAEQGDFDIPADFKLGFTFHPNDSVALNLDIEHIWYSDVDSIANSIVNVFSCPTAGQGGTDLEGCLGGDRGAGFAWDDMTVYKAGVRWKAGQDWTWRLGYSYGAQPISKSEMSFNILAPGVIEQHITAGFTLERTPGRQFNMAFMYAPNKSVTGPQNFDPTQNVTFEMYQWEIEGSYSWRF